MNLLRSALCTLSVVAATTLVMTVLVPTVSAETKVDGKLSGETRWTKEGSPYIAVGDVVVPKGSKLYVGPGVTVRFKPDIASREGVNAFDLELLVEGTLEVEGAEGDTVYFTSDGTERTWMDWQGIVLRGESARATITAAVIEFANNGVKCLGGRLTARDMTVHYCSETGVTLYGASGDFDNVVMTTIGNLGGTSVGIFADRKATANVRNSFFVGSQTGLAFSRNSSGKVEDSVISSCAGNGIVIRNSNPTITRCTITDNEYGLKVSAGAHPVVRNNNIFQNGTAELWLTEYGKGPVKVDFAYNWWGHTSLGFVEERILDGLDDTRNTAFAVIEPVLEAPFNSEEEEQAEP